MGDIVLIIMNNLHFDIPKIYVIRNYLLFDESHEKKIWDVFLSRDFCVGNSPSWVKLTIRLLYISPRQ